MRHNQMADTKDGNGSEAKAGASNSRDQTTEILCALGEEHSKQQRSPSELLPLVYDELRSLARGFLARERAGHTLQPTALVHDAFLRLVDQTRVDWKGRGHFFAVAASMMRRVLVDSARRHKSRKRGAGWRRVTLGDDVLGQELVLEDLLALDDALGKLGELDPRQTQVVELRFFAGFGVEETAKLLGVSKRTVEGDWTHARAWLGRELAPE